MDDIFEHSIDNDNFCSLLEAGLLESGILIGIVVLARSYRCVLAIFFWNISPTSGKTNMSLRILQIVKHAKLNLSLGFESLDSKSKKNRQHE